MHSHTARVSRAWLPAVHAAGRDGLRFHDLRHTAVALAIAQGAHPKAIQSRMGHSSVAVTLDRYGHLFEGLDGRIADGLETMYLEALAASPRPERGLDGRRNNQLTGNFAGQSEWPSGVAA